MSGDSINTVSSVHSSTNTLLHVSDNKYILYGMDFYIKGDAQSLTIVTEKILGEARNYIYSKTKWVLSDTDAAQKRSLREIIQNIMKVDRIVEGEPLWGACNLHNAGRSEHFGKEQLRVVPYVYD